MLKQKEGVVVIGAGPAGIGAGIALGERGMVLDGCQELGGLCRTIEFDGAVFDLGGHSFHTPHPEIRDLVFSSLEMHEQRRDARCYSHGEMIPYPFQANFRQIGDLGVVRDCAVGLATADGGTGAGNFEEFVERRFGAGIARHFMLPYNRKLWGVDLKRLAADWVSERVAAPEGTSEKFASSGGTRKPLQADTTVAYPARGGFGEIVRAVARRLEDLRLGKIVLRLDPVRRKLIMEGQEVIHWSRIVSTIPINKLLEILPDVPPSLTQDASRLQFLSLALVLVVINHPVDTSIQRVYCADPEMPFHKIAINHTSSPYLRSLPYHGVMAELSYAAENPLPHGELERSVVQGLIAMGIIKSVNEVHAVKVITVPYGYPVPTHDREIIVCRLRDWLEERRIHTVGRFGEWAYINSDEALYRGLSLGRALADLE